MIKNPYPGKFIALEGVEGSGKTTQVALLKTRMKKEGYPVLLTKEPTAESIFGRLVRFIYTCESLYDELPPELEKCIQGRDYQLIKEMAEDAKRRHVQDFETIIAETRGGDHANLPMLIQLGMIFDRHEHRVRQEIPTLGTGTHVVSDRDFFSTLAYGTADGIGWRKLLGIHYDILGEHFIVPDLIILLEVPVELGLERTLAKQAGKKEYFDTPDRMTKIHLTYRGIAADPVICEAVRVEMVDGTGEKDSVHQNIWQHAELLLQNGGGHYAY